MGWRLRLSGKTGRKFAELPIYCQRQKCRPGKVVSGSIRFMQIFAGFPGEGASNESVVVENNDFRLFRSLSSEHFTYMATRQLSRDATVDDLGVTVEPMVQGPPPWTDCSKVHFWPDLDDMAHTPSNSSRTFSARLAAANRAIATLPPADLHL